MNSLFMKKKFALFLLIIFQFNSFPGFSDNYPDSLNQILKKTINDSIRANVKLSLGVYYQYKDPYRSLLLASSALLDARRANNKNLEANALRAIGVYYSFKTITDTAAMYLDSALSRYTSTGHFSGLALTHLYIGENFESSASWDKALLHFLKCAEHSQQAGNKKVLAQAYEKVGQVLINMNRLDEALIYARKGVFISESIKNDYESAKIYNIEGIIFDYRGELDSALFYYDKALAINNRLGSNYDGAIILMNMGVIYLTQGKLEMAEEKTLEGLNLMLTFDEKGSIAACYINLGEIYSKQGLYAKAIEFLDKGIVILTDLKRYDFLLEGLRIKAETLKNNKDFENALIVFERYTGIKDSIFNAESNKNITEMQTKFKSKEQEVEIKLHQAETAKQKSINNFIIGIIILVALIAVFLVKAYRDKRKANTLLQSQKQEIENQKEIVDHAYQELHEKNKEILDSIHYAQRIQKALLTSEKYIDRNLNKLTKKE
ncbi:MAG: nprA [Bacteroidota bacterium]|nr:nprA [Bacteroidota bacterium]